MVMSTRVFDQAAQLAQLVLIDMVQILDIGAPVTVGVNVTRSLTPVGLPVPGLVQTTTLANAVEGRVSDTYSVKVARGTELRAGQVVRVLFCRAEPDLAGRELLIDKVSENGLALIRKAVASNYHAVDSQGKGALA